MTQPTVIRAHSVALYADDQLPTVLFVYPSSLKYIAIDASTSLSQTTATAFIEKTLSADATDTETLASVPLFPSPEVAKKKPKVALQTLTAAHVRACVTATSKKMCVLVAGSGEDSADEAVRSLAKKYRRDPFSFFSSSSDTAAFQAAKAFVGTDDDVEVLVLKPGRKVKYSGWCFVDMSSLVVCVCAQVSDSCCSASAIARGGEFSRRVPGQAAGRLKLVHGSSARVEGA